MSRKLQLRPFSEIPIKAPPKCEVCKRQKWYFGSTIGWRCPDCNEVRV